METVSSRASNSESCKRSKTQAIFATNGKIFQTGQIWSFHASLDLLPLYYGRIHKITATHVLDQEAVYKLHINRLKATSFPQDVYQWRDKQMHVGCGTFYARKALETITSDDLSLQLTPQVSMDGNEFHYTILPKTGEVWVIYRFWSQFIESERLGLGTYDIVEILDDTLDYKVLLLEKSGGYNEDKIGDKNVLFQVVTEYKYNEIEGSEPIFIIPKAERLRFSHKVPASRVTKEIYGELKDVVEVDSGALPHNLIYDP